MQKTVLITGCSDGGIGHALAEEFHARGLKVFATARNVKTMEKLKEKGIETLPLDVTDTNSIQCLKAQISETTGGTLDILVNNAGACYQAAASDDAMTRIKSLFDVNIFGTMEMTQAFVPLIIESNRRHARSEGRVVMIGSLSALVPTIFYSAYNSSKAAMFQYANTLRIELAPFGIKVVTAVEINTGRVASRIIRDEDPLPEGSVYAPIKEVYETVGRTVFTAKGTSGDEYARVTVSHILGPASPFLWAADESWKCWIFDYFPRTFWDWAFRGQFSLDKLAAAFKETYEGRKRR
ncbi:hypothetical protein EIP91_005231 [Steccherinum ochraceum]|uniref:NADPH-dependent 1-acyldihydroxyacetone phosphate reductase n=1 Tax=Steccherinum ochraceum TaxID=92696 RepID=A0A4R0R7F0_9APHY|nr:hypothetical protein EIP91_005231 [Steccherinum ochraceum]